MAKDINTGITIPTPTIVDEKTKIAAAKADAQAQKVGYGGTVGSSVTNQVSNVNYPNAGMQTVTPKKVNQMTPAELKEYQQQRVDANAADRIATQTGNNPDNPMPTEDPGKGMHWANYGGVWKTYPDTIAGSGNGNGNGGNGNGGNGNGSGTSTDTSKPVITDATKDAFAILTDLFTSYGLGSLAGEISGYMTSGLTASEALIKLKTNPTGAYAERFAGNFARTKAGLNAMSESAYIELENSYTNTLKAYGLGNMLSTDSKANWKQFSTWIGNDLSATEFKDRIKTVEDRVVNADPGIKETFKQFYPSLTDKDLVSYFLSPTETIDKLKEKVTAAEIGSAFLGQGLTTDVQTATGFAQYGIDRATALQGAADIKSVLPASEKLSSIYGEAGINYNQKSGESEFLKSNQDAAEQRKRLKSLERAKFQGDSGVNSQYGSLAKNTQGVF